MTGLTETVHGLSGLVKECMAGMGVVAGILRSTREALGLDSPPERSALTLVGGAIGAALDEARAIEAGPGDAPRPAG